MQPPTPAPVYLDRVLQNSNDALFLVNAARVLVWVNPALEARIGLPAARLLGQECREHGPTEPGDVAGLVAALGPPPAAFAGAPCRREAAWHHADGRRTWHAFQFLPLAGPDGSIAAVLGRVGPADPDAAPAAGEPLRQLLDRLRHRLWHHFGLERFVAAGPAMRRVLAQVELAGAGTGGVLIRGEPGTGKRHLARALHGRQRDRAFLALDCAALAPPVLERQLVELAAVPTPSLVYLRQPELLSRDHQARLLALLEAPGRRHRILAGTAADLAQASRAGHFLAEVFFHLTTLVIELPSLRERGEDLPLLVQQALERCNAEGSRQVIGLQAEAWRVVRAYHWPGNLVELEEVIRQAHQAARGPEITADDLPARLRTAVDLAELPGAAAEQPLPLDAILEEAERRLIQLALRQARGNLTRAATRLGIFRPRLYRRMQHFGLAEDGTQGKIEVAPEEPE